MPGTNLTRAEAQERAAVIDVHHYDIALDLLRGPRVFSARTTITFSANTPGAETFIDLIAESVEQITLNGVSLDPAEAFRDSRIHLTDLAPKNTVEIHSTQRYTNTGEGLHRFVDPVDGEIYLYSQFEVPDARRMYPVFEQPDLKATFAFTITAPARWKVVSNQPTPEPIDAGVAGDAADRPGEAVARWEFSPTPVMSSYITALIAGPYAEIRSELTNREGRTIPLGVFCRSSLEPHLDAEYIFDITRRGFDFFERIFDFPYPFEKYDQLFVPEFNMGAMENIGAVTHTEAYVFRGQVTDAIRERRVVTILHELAHMWFGDLVTMRWWNDLWLNESFAEFTSTLATAEATEWTDCWTTFAASEKSWAYRQDQLPTTHPIVADIRDLDDILTNFDGITYAKGASVLKALVAYVGREAFLQGVHRYFVTHQYGNTELRDLLVELEAASGRPLQDWSTAWLETAGVNTLRAELTVGEDGVVSDAAVIQTAEPEVPTLRPHRIVIGAYRVIDGVLQRTERFEADVAPQERTELRMLAGMDMPDLLLVNDEDLTYAKVRLDPRSLETVERYLGTLEDSLARTVLWGVLWDMTRDGEYPARRFIEVATRHLGAETASTTLRLLLGQLDTAAGFYTDPDSREQTVTELGDALWQLADAAPAGTDQQFQLVSAAARAAVTDTQLDRVAALLAGDAEIDGLTVDQDLRWALTVALAAGGRVTDAEIDAELARDHTASGRQFAAQARAALHTAAAKDRAWHSVFTETDAPNLIVRFTGAGFGNVHDAALLEPYVAPYFDSLMEVWETRSYQITEELVDGFYPARLASSQLAAAAREWLVHHPDAPAPLRRMVVENLAGTERAIRAQQADAQAADPQ